MPGMRSGMRSASGSHSRSVGTVNWCSADREMRECCEQACVQVMDTEL